MSLEPSHDPSSDDSRAEARREQRDCFADGSGERYAPLCSTRIAPECLHIETHGVVRVSLAVPQEGWFEFLRKLGPATQLIRSPVAGLAINGPYPIVASQEQEVVPRSQCGLFSPNLAEFASLWAVREILEDGPLYLLEVRDARGQACQRIVIPGGEARFLFQEFVHAHQSPLRQCKPWFPPNHRAATKRRFNLANRIPWLRRRWDQGASEVRALTLRQVEDFLIRIVEAGQRVRTVLHNQAVIWGAVWVPEMHTSARIAGPAGPQPMRRFFRQNVGLELYGDQPASAWLWAGHCACCDEEKWTLEVGGPDDDIALAITAPDDAGEMAWRDFLKPLREA